MTRRFVRCWMVALLLVVLGAGSPPTLHAVGASPGPTPGTGRIWVDEAVRSRDVVCSVSVTDASGDSADEILEEHLACTVEMTDARTGGDLTADITVTFAPAGAAAATWSGTFALANDRSEWKGWGQGAASRVAGSVAPALYGQVSYRGSRACRGLVYVQMLAGEAAPSVLGGWIVGPTPGADQWLARVGTLMADTVALAGRRL